MEKPRDRRKGAEPESPIVGESTSLPEAPETEELVSQSPGKRVTRKVKKTWSLDEELVRRIEIAAASLGVEECDLVAKMIAPGLRGLRLPTVPSDLKALFPAERTSAA